MCTGLAQHRSGAGAGSERSRPSTTQTLQSLQESLTALVGVPGGRVWAPEAAVMALSGAGSPRPRAGAGWARAVLLEAPGSTGGCACDAATASTRGPGSALASADFVMMGPGRKGVWVSLNFKIVPFPLLPKDSDTRRILPGGRRPAGGRVECPGSQHPGPLLSSVQTFCHQRPACVCKSVGRSLV